MHETSSRRQFMRFLATSPALYGAARVYGQAPADLYAPQAVATAGEAINVFDMHEAASRALMPGHYTYMALGTDDGGTLARRSRGSAATSMTLLIKGIVTAEDARLAVAHGVDGVIVSNHGGRSEDSGRSTIESLPEVVAAIDGRMPVIVDSGFRRGTDIFKALALGADAVAIGRPYLWGLSAFGQDGVEAVLDILGRELGIVMRQTGTPRIRDIGRSHLV